MTQVEELKTHTAKADELTEAIKKFYAEPGDVRLKGLGLHKMVNDFAALFRHDQQVKVQSVSFKFNEETSKHELDVHLTVKGEKLKDLTNLSFKNLTKNIELESLAASRELIPQELVEEIINRRIEVIANTVGVNYEDLDLSETTYNIKNSLNEYNKETEELKKTIQSLSRQIR